MSLLLAHRPQSSDAMTPNMPLSLSYVPQPSATAQSPNAVQRSHIATERGAGPVGSRSHTGEARLNMPSALDAGNCRAPVQLAAKPASGPVAHATGAVAAGGAKALVVRERSQPLPIASARLPFKP